MPKRGKKVYTRVCQRCGTQWTLPRVLAKEQAPTARQLANVQRASRFTLGGLKSRQRMNASIFEMDTDRYVRNRTCPNCGTMDYRQYKPGDPNIPEAPRGFPPALVRELQRLTFLRDTGRLTDEEYENQRDKALGRDPATGWLPPLPPE